MSQPCSQCRALRTENSRLQSDNIGLRRRVEYLQDRLSELRGAVTATVTVIDDETDAPTMPPRRLVSAVRAQLDNALDAVNRRR